MENIIYYGCRKENGCRNIDYYLTEESVSERYTDMMRYGIRIEETVTYPGGGKTIDMKQLGNVFYRYADADTFMRRLMRDMVSPRSLDTYVENHIQKLRTIPTAHQRIPETAP